MQKCRLIELSLNSSHISLYLLLRLVLFFTYLEGGNCEYSQNVEHLVPRAASHENKSYSRQRKPHLIFDAIKHKFIESSALLVDGVPDSQMYTVRALTVQHHHFLTVGEIR